MDFLVALVLPVITLAAFGLCLWSSAWAYQDARMRGKRPMLVALLVLFAGWPISLLLWIAFRPDGVGRSPFNLDDYRVQ